MGYACPVCAAPQADGEHLANHLAFTALLRGDDHEAWLAEHVPDWAERDPGTLAPEVVEFAEKTEHDAVFGDATGDRPDFGSLHGLREYEPSGELGPEARRIVEGAVEMTRERRSGGDREE